ncbi:MAG: hypothetical protein ACP5D9_08130, partial [Mariniphaga sp.]
FLCENIKILTLKFHFADFKTYEIPNYQYIDFDFVKKNTSARVLTQLMYQGNYVVYNSLDIKKESLTFVSSNVDANVKFYKEDGKVYVTSLRSAKSSQLSLAEARVLALIANSPMPNLLDEIFSGRILEKEKEKLARFGLPEDTDFNDYFTYIFTEQNGLMFYPSKKGEGLLPVTENDDHYIYALLRNLNNNKLLLDELPQKKEQRELGFVLKKGYRFSDGYYGRYHDFYDDDFANVFENGTNERYEIIPITGKTRKNDTSRLATHIKEYDEEMDTRYIIDKSENTKKLLRLIDEMEHSKGGDFHLMKKAFGYLRNEKFVYGLTNDTGKIRKKDLEEIALSPDPADVVFEVSKRKEFLTLGLKIKTGNELQKRKVLNSKPALPGIL